MNTVTQDTATHIGYAIENMATVLTRVADNVFQNQKKDEKEKLASLKEVLKQLDNPDVEKTPTTYLLFGELGDVGSFMIEVEGPMEFIERIKKEGLHPVWPHPRVVGQRLVSLLKIQGLVIPFFKVTQTETPKTPAVIDRSIEGIKPVVIEGMITEIPSEGSDDIVFIVSDGRAEQAFAEQMEDFKRKFVTVQYWICDKKLPLEEIQRLALESIFGIVDADYGANYGDETGYLWTDEEAKVGGHNLMDEVRSHKGKYLYMEIYVHGQ